MRRIIEQATSWTTLIAFTLGLWLGYRGAVVEARTCRRPSHTHLTACPEWLRRE
jgi:hypothetical protein